MSGGDGEGVDEGGDSARLQPGVLPRPADAPPITPAKAPVALPPYTHQAGAGAPAPAAPAPSAAPTIDPTIKAAIDPNAPAPEFMGGPKAAPMTPEQVATGGKPQVPQKDGTISTEKSIGIEMDGKYYVIPTIVNGKSLTPEAAIAAFEQGTNKPLGEFKSEDEATAFAEDRSRALDKATGGAGDLKKGPSNPAETFDEPHPLAPYKGRNPYADILAGIDPKTGKVNPAMVQYWASKEGKSRKSGVIAEKQALDKDVIEWNKARKDFGSKQSAETKAAAAADKAEAKGTYGKKYDALQSGKIEEGITQEVERRTGNKEDKVPSIFNNGTDPIHINDLAMGIMTANPDMGPKRAVQAVGSLARWNTDDTGKNDRMFDVLKPDKVGNVVVKLKDSGDEYHLPPATFKKLNTIIAQNWAKHQKTATEAKTSGGVGKATGDALSEIGAALPGYITSRRGLDKGPLGDIFRAGTYPARKAVETLRNPPQTDQAPPGTTFDSR